MKSGLSNLCRTPGENAGLPCDPFGVIPDPVPAGPVASRKLLLPALAAVLLCLSACGGGGSGSPPPSMPAQPPPDDGPPPGPGGFVPDREVVVSFPALLQGGTPEEVRQADAEAARVTAMHERGGTGEGQIVGTLDSGANPGHPDLEGQFAHTCAMGNCDDGRPSLNRPHDSSPVRDTPDSGHGTIVNGIIAANKNDRGVYGIAYRARIASFGNTSSVVHPWGNLCPAGVSCTDAVRSRDHQWGDVFDQQTARGIDWMRSLGVRVTNMSWTRTYPWTAERGLTAVSVRAIMPTALTAFETYVGAGGVAVWANGNEGQPNPIVEAALPKYFTNLEKGWLAVAGLGGNGLIGPRSNRCGIAADWCIAAPEVVTTTILNGKWNVAGGTSIAAPYVSASLAALKSLFPNLSHHQLRDRILETAIRTGPYSDAAVYGRGRLDLDAASRPVGGTNFALGGRDRGPVLSTAGARAVLPRGAIDRYIRGRSLLVFDGYQRAPFKVGLEVFAEPRNRYLSIDDHAFAPRRHRREEREGYATLSLAGSGLRAQGLSRKDSFLGFGRGADVAQGLARLAGASLPVGGYRMSRNAAGVALGLADGYGHWHAVAVAGAAEPDRSGFGVSGWSPETVLAVSFAPGGTEGMSGADAFGISFASQLDRPMGWAGSGALDIEADSFELAWRRKLAGVGVARLDLTSRATHLAVREDPLLQFDDALLAAMELEFSFRPSPLATVQAFIGAERPVSAVAGRLRAAAAVSESGRIAYRDIKIDGRDLLSFDKAGLVVGFTDHSDTSLGLGITAVRDGFGRTEALVGVQVDLAF